MRASSFCLALLLAASLLPLQADAAKKKKHHAQVAKEAAPVVPPVQPPADFADAFHEAMHSRDRTKVLSMLAPDLVVFETGYLEATRDDYVKSNLDDDTAFASATEYRPMSRGVIGSGDSMTVLTKASIKGVVGGQSVDLTQSETMILRRTQTAWEIVHLHWSAHTRQADEPEPRVQAEAPVATPAPASPATSVAEPAPAPESAPESVPGPESAPEPTPTPTPTPTLEPAPAPESTSEQEQEPTPVPAPVLELESQELLQPVTELTAPAVPEAKPEESKTP